MSSTTYFKIPRFDQYAHRTSVDSYAEVDDIPTSIESPCDPNQSGFYVVKEFDNEGEDYPKTMTTGVYAVASKRDSSGRISPWIFFSASLLALLASVALYYFGRYEWLIAPIFGVIAFGTSGVVVTSIRRQLKSKDGF